MYCLKRIIFCFFLFVVFGVFSSPFAEERCTLREFSCDAIKLTENRIFFFTQPRSGTIWTAYILKHFTKRPLSLENCYYNSYEQCEDLSLPFIHHEHSVNRFLLNIHNNFYSFAPPDKEKDKILMIIRNPLDTLLRLSTSFQDALDNIRKSSEICLFFNLRYCESWPQANQYIFYYEDLLDYPKEEIEKLLQFVEASTDEVEDFIANLDYHINKVLTYYDKHLQSKTEGKDRLLYQREYTPEQLKTLVGCLKEIDREMWKKHLKRYEIYTFSNKKKKANQEN